MLTFLGLSAQQVAAAAVQREQELGPRVALLCAGMMLSLVAANTTILSLPLALGACRAAVLTL